MTTIIDGKIKQFNDEQELIDFLKENGYTMDEVIILNETGRSFGI